MAVHMLASGNAGKFWRSTRVTQQLGIDYPIYRDAGSEGLVKSFQHIEPTPQGKIEIYFTPNVNYPSVSAIEVLAE